MSMFWPEQVNAMVNALALHEKTVSINSNYFKELLYPHTEYQSPKGNFAYTPLAEGNNISQDEGNNSLSIDGILYNRAVESIFLRFQESGVFMPFYEQPVVQEKKKFWQKVFPKSVAPRPVYFIDDILKELNNEEMVRILMSHPPAPHTLLCRLRCITYDNDGVTIQTRPVLVKPGISPEDEKIVYQWERNNIKSERKEDY